jgi:quinol---cytochrome-c reductase cytochrome c subunit
VKKGIAAIVLGALSLAMFAGGAPAQDQAVADGKVLFDNGCSSCHGADLRGIPGRGPNLRGVGEAAADFYIRTGRMPLRVPDQQPLRTESPYTKAQQQALIAYVGSFGGPGIPSADPARGDLADGLKLFGEYCMGCHQVVAQGGITTTGIAPALQSSSPTDVAEAVQIGPYVMPTFPQLSQPDVDSLARYVTYTRDPEDIGGWGIGHIGPIPEGIVAWLLAGVALLLVIRLIGERTTE